MRRSSASLLLLFATLVSAVIVACDDDPDQSSRTANADSGAAPALTAGTTAPSEATIWEIRENFGRYFADAGVTGSFLLYDPQKDLFLTNDTARSRKRFTPASTFKIFNSLVFLETGVIRDENEVLAWDSVSRTIDSWNRDHTLRTAIEHSVVWFYQELARRIGRERLQHYLDTVDYGNRTIGDNVDAFWLDGSLRISPQEQIEFLSRLHRNALPFSQRTIDIVKDITVRRRSKPGKDSVVYTYRGKTGWSLRTDENIGWFVGWLECEDGVWFFALNIDMKGEETLNARTEIPWNILRDLGLVE